MKKIVILFVVFFSCGLIFFVNPINAQIDLPEGMTYEKVNPDREASYKIKRFKEKISSNLKFSKKSKIKFQKELLNKRLAEIAYVVDNKLLSYTETSTGRYSATAGKLTEYLRKNKLSDEVDSMKLIFDSHEPSLKKARDEFSADRSEYRLFQYDIDYLNTYKKQLDEIKN